MLASGILTVNSNSKVSIPPPLPGDRRASGGKRNAPAAEETEGGAAETGPHPTVESRFCANRHYEIV